MSVSIERLRCPFATLVEPTCWFVANGMKFQTVQDAIHDHVLLKHKGLSRMELEEQQARKASR